MNARMIVGCLALLMGTFALAVPDAAIAQPGGGPPGGFGRGGGSMFLLMNDKVREELGIVEDQVAELTAMQEDMQIEMREMFRDGGGDREEMRTKMAETMKVFQEKVDTILLPHQQERLKQLAFQSSARGRAGGSLLNNDELKETLGITAEQEDKMKEVAEKEQEQLRVEILKLQRAAEEKVLAVLDAEQQKKYRELVGEAFDFGEQQFGRGGRGGPGGQGGRGGRPGGDGQSDF